MNRKYLLFVLLALLATQAGAQLFTLPPKQVEKLKGRKLVVVLEEEKAFFLNKFKSNQSKLQQYKKIIAETNTNLQSVFPVYWTVSSEVIFKTESEAAKLPPDSGYILAKYHFNDKVFNLAPDLDSYSIRRQMFREAAYGKLEFTFIEKQKTGSFLTWFVPTSYPFEGDLIAAVSQLNYFLVIKLVKPTFTMKEYEEIIEERNGEVVKRTLLIDSAQVEKQFGKFRYIDEEYPYDFKLTSIEEITAAIKSKDSAYAYVAIMPHYDVVTRGGSFEGTSGGGMDRFSNEIYFTHLVIDCSDFEILGIGKGIEPVVNRRALKHYVKDIEKEKDSDNINLEK